MSGFMYLPPSRAEDIHDPLAAESCGSAFASAQSHREKIRGLWPRPA